MNFTKIIAVLLFPIGLAQILAVTNIFSLDVGMDIGLIGAGIMILVQILSMMSVKKEYDKHSISNMVSFIIFVGVAGYYIASTLIGFTMWEPLPLILAVMMFLEGMYAIH